MALERLLARLVLRVVRVRVSVQGRENVPEAGPVILAANHTSYADIPVLLGHLPPGCRIVAKEEVLSWPLVGTFVRRAGHPTVDRWDFRRSVEDSRAIAERLAADERILFFPEGTFVRAAGLRPFRLGAFEAATETGSPVVPVAIEGNRRVLPLGTILPHPGRVRLWIGSAIAPEGEGWPAVIRGRDRAFETILARCGEPKLEMVAGGPPPRDRP